MAWRTKWHVWSKIHWINIVPILIWSRYTTVDESYREFLGGKTYMMPVSPWFYTNMWVLLRPFLAYVTKRWLLSRIRGLDFERTGSGEEIHCGSIVGSKWFQWNLHISLNTSKSLVGMIGVGTITSVISPAESWLTILFWTRRISLHRPSSTQGIPRFRSRKSPIQLRCVSWFFVYFCAASSLQSQESKSYP